MSFLSSDFLFRNALAGGLFVALLCGMLGVYVVLRRFALLGVALPQASAAGIACSFLVLGHSHAAGGLPHAASGAPHAAALVGSVAATFGALALLVFTSRRSQIPEDGRIGALLAIASAATVLFVAANPKGDFELTGLLRGELLAISDGDLALLAGVALATAALFGLFRRELLLASFDPDFARTLGKDPRRADALLYSLLGATISIGVMTAGPLVVFGFLTLPALCALRVAPGIGWAFAIAAAVSAVSSVAGFGIAYAADLPAGPVDVAVAAALWLAVSGFARLRTAARSRAALLSLLLAAAGVVSGGCAGVLGAGDGDEASALAPLPRGTLPDPTRPVVVLRFRNDTGQTLRLADPNPLKDLGRAAGDPFAKKGLTALDQLEAIAAEELARRGFTLVAFEEARRVAPNAPADPASAGFAAQRAGLDALVLQGTLSRFTLSPSRVLLITLDLALVDPRDGRIVWSGRAHGPFPVPAALTLQEAVRDAGPPVFARAFGAG
jgi:ABC-type Mn2+/Zn2+ transport system permease subunit